MSKSFKCTGIKRLIYDKLNEKISCLPTGAPLPPVSELKKEFGVGQATICGVLSVLNEEKKIVTKKPRGSFVLKRESLLKSSPAEPSAYHYSWAMPKKTTLRVKLYAYGRDLTAFTRLIDAYNQDDRKIRAECVILPENPCDIARELEYFDLAILPYPHFEDLWAGRAPLACLDLSDFRKGLADELFEGAWLKERDGIRCVFPTLTTRFFAYRKDISGKAGIVWSENPGWSEIEKNAVSLKSRTGTRKAMFLVGNMSFFHSFGVRLADEDKRRICFDSKKVKPVLDILKRLTVDLELCPFCSETFGGTSRILEKYPLAETFSCFDFDEQNTGFFPVPVEAGGKDFLAGFAAYVCRASPCHEEIFDFLMFLLARQGQDILAENPSWLPSRKDTASNLSRKSEKYKVMFNSALRGRMVYSDSTAPFLARMIIESEMEKWLKSGSGDIEILQKSIEEKSGAFLRDILRETES